MTLHLQDAILRAPFSLNSTDQTVEQTINSDEKTSGGMLPIHYHLCLIGV